MSNFLFVAGDIGGTRMMIPVAKKLVSLGHEINFIMDGEGMGYKILAEEKLDFLVQYPQSTKFFVDFHGNADLVFISTCASACGIGKLYADVLMKNPKYTSLQVVFGADGFFNHSYKWRDYETDYWFAINEAHKRSILGLRVRFPQGRVRVVGQPAFDGILDLIPKKDEIRQRVRKKLNLFGATIFLWWSQGMSEVIEEDIDWLLKAIEAMPLICETPVLIPKIHPKLDNIKSGFVAEIKKSVLDQCLKCGVQYIDAGNIIGEELCLASDVILSITATEDIKNWLMGGPPVVHIVGPVVRKWFEESLLLDPPSYLPDIQTGEALLITDREKWFEVLEQALDPTVKANLRKNWIPPEGKATDLVAEELVKIARS